MTRSKYEAELQIDQYVKVSTAETAYRHAHLVRALLEGNLTGYSLLSPDNLKGPALSIDVCIPAGGKVLRSLGVQKVDEFCAGIDHIDPTQIYHQAVEAKKMLLRYLKKTPDGSLRLVTIFDHKDDLVGSCAAREIHRILMPGGQCLTTVGNRNNAPGLSDESFLEQPNNKTTPLMGLLGDQPKLENGWLDLPFGFGPNKHITVVTKR